MTHEAVQNSNVVDTWDFVQGDSEVSNQEGDAVDNKIMAQKF